MLTWVWEHLRVVVSQHSSLQILHEPPPFPSHLSPLFCPACLSVNPSNTITQLRKLKREEEEEWGGGIFTKVLYFSVYYSDWVWVTEGCLAVTVCNAASLNYVVPIFPVSSTLCFYLPLAISLFFCFVLFFVCLFFVCFLLFCFCLGFFVFELIFTV